MGIEQGRPVLRAKDVEKLDPMVVLGQGISNIYLQGCVLGSHDLYILLRERNNSCRVSLCPVLASFTLSTKTNETLKYDLRCRFNPRSIPWLYPSMTRCLCFQIMLHSQLSSCWTPNQVLSQYQQKLNWKKKDQRLTPMMMKQSRKQRQWESQDLLTYLPKKTVSFCFMGHVFGVTRKLLFFYVLNNIVVKNKKNCI
ncbi:uncharacterized protein LOC130794520 isoform X1 [Actinidia eriantha]|uniref:uncharacterized protein LOC130794520 isoform X1 n=1 Tax=Actinidia eriantha TaxID=165200 RepID=UPI002582D76F|nr:uncharacterized protein LOC130794520 isoform X1 [Actinidia eriantha]